MAAAGEPQGVDEANLAARAAASAAKAVAVAEALVEEVARNPTSKTRLQVIRQGEKAQELLKQLSDVQDQAQLRSRLHVCIANNTHLLKKPQDRLSAATSATQQDPHNRTAWRVRGSLLLEVSPDDASVRTQAIGCHEIAVAGQTAEDTELQIVCHRQLIDLYRQERRFDDARASAKRLTESDANDGATQIELGKVHRDEEKWEFAITAFSSALRDPRLAKGTKQHVEQLLQHARESRPPVLRDSTVSSILITSGSYVSAHTSKTPPWSHTKHHVLQPPFGASIVDIPFESKISMQVTSNRGSNSTPLTHFVKASRIFKGEVESNAPILLNIAREAKSRQNEGARCIIVQLPERRHPPKQQRRWKQILSVGYYGGTTPGDRFSIADWARQLSSEVVDIPHQSPRIKIPILLVPFDFGSEIWDGLQTAHTWQQKNPKKMQLQIRFNQTVDKIYAGGAQKDIPMLSDVLSKSFAQRDAVTEIMKLLSRREAWNFDVVESINVLRNHCNSEVTACQWGDFVVLTIRVAELRRRQVQIRDNGEHVAAMVSNLLKGLLDRHLTRYAWVHKTPGDVEEMTPELYIALADLIVSTAHPAHPHSMEVRTCTDLVCWKTNYAHPQCAPFLTHRRHRTWAAHSCHWT